VAASCVLAAALVLPGGTAWPGEPAGAAAAASVHAAPAAGLAASTPPGTATGSGTPPPTSAAVDRAALATLRAELDTAAARLVGADQGVHVETAAGDVLVARAATRAVHPASVMKVATSLALLRRLGATYRFRTRFVPTGAVRDGVLSGDLVVEAGGDPFFVDENAALVSLALAGLGVHRVEGALVTRGTLLFNWQSRAAAGRLARALGGQVPPAAWRAVTAHAAAGTARAPAITFGTARAGGTLQPPLLTHESPPLVTLLKALNGYSNNVLTPLADAAGGSAAVEAVARASVPGAAAEVRVGDGAGLDPGNRLSPRAAVGLLRALDTELAASGHSLAAVLPVAGVDAGTLRQRLDAAGERGHIVAKTGTFGDYGACALAGAVRSRDFGTVYFAVLNAGVGIAAARSRQDAFVRLLLARLATTAWPYAPDPAPAFTQARIQAGLPRNRRRRRPVHAVPTPTGRSRCGRPNR
jgi:D-alanyl-D-alanine carboxypeptidase/D-alanyl-D-alanine-endopeptidase (penicillin-binding protein 4)